MQGNKMIELFDNILERISDNIKSEMEISRNKSEWINNNIAGLTPLAATDLACDLDLEKHVYLVYKETSNPKFSQPPIVNHFSFQPDRKYTVTYDATMDVEVIGDLYFIGYEKEKKVQQVLISAGQEKTIKINPDCDKFRLAIRLEGKGVYKLKGIKFTLNPPEETEQALIQFDNGNMGREALKSLKNISELKIACIFDEFSTESFSKECKLIPFTPENWKTVFLVEKPHILMVESAWKGPDLAWKNKIREYKGNPDIKAVIKFCKKNNIPTVFWNKEDPVHFDKFISTASQFDYIFTTDKNMIPSYKEASGHENVFAMPFSAQPVVHNPIRKYKREDGICFAGTYYGERHPDRKKDMDAILKVCKPHNLVIYDRNYLVPDTPFVFPEEYTNNVKGTLKYSEIDKAYKGYKVMLNVNSVKNSPTMFSRRVFEGLACGTPIISTYSKGISQMFGDIIIASDDWDFAEKEINTLTSNDSIWKKRSLEGIRRVMLNHTYSDRLRFILGKIGIGIEKRLPRVAVVTLTNSEETIKKLIKTFNEQNYLNKELIIFINGDDQNSDQLINKYNTNNIKCYIKDYIEEHYESISQLIDCDYFAYLDSSLNNYGTHYLTDLVVATIYTNSEIIGKGSYYTQDSNHLVLNNEDEYVYTNELFGDRSIISQNLLRDMTVSDYFELIRGKQSLKHFFEIGYRLFSIDNNNFVENFSETSNTDIKNIFF
jgi:spore maturation protein CgeB